MNIFQFVTPSGDYFVSCIMQEKKVESAKVYPIVDGLIYPPLLMDDLHLQEILADVNQIL